jgi:hypothetical protein
MQHWDYSGAAPSGGPPGGRCMKLMVAKAPSTVWCVDGVLKRRRRLFQ